MRAGPILSAMLSRRVLWHALLALLLVFSQQQAVLHVLGHALGPARLSSPAAASHQADHDTLCAQCLAFAQLDHQATPQAALPALLPARFELAAAPAVASQDARFEPVYRSRAPPRG